MSYTDTDTDCIICVTDNGDISNVHTDFDLSDILVSSEDMVDKIWQLVLTLSLRKNGATVSITFSNWQRNGATVDESYFLLSCSMTS